MGAYCAWKGHERVRRRRWKEANRSRTSETNAAWYLANRDRKAAAGRAWQEANRERLRDINRAWKEANRERLREQERVRRRASRAADPAAARARDAAYRERNRLRERERNREASRRYREANRERRNATRRERYADDPTSLRSAALRRRARQLAAPGLCSPTQLAARQAMWGSRCWLCDAPATTVDHVKPWAKGGSNWPANLRPACGPCNSRKRDRWPWPDLEAKLDAMRARRLRKVAA